MDIPEINRDGNLVSRLLAMVLVGFDRVLDNESRLYLRLLTRLADKAFNEYVFVKECLLEEIKNNDKLIYRIEIVNHLENCVGAISRVSKIIDKLANGVSLPDKTRIKKDFNIYKLISARTKKRILKKNISNIRNRVEHIDEDIYLNKFKDGLFLDLSKDYKNITINTKSVSFKELVSIISLYHELMLEIFSNLPNRIDENGKYYYDKIPRE